MKFFLFLYFGMLAYLSSAQTSHDPVQEAIRVDAGTKETTMFGQKVNNTDSLIIGERGPTLLEDFMLREKIMHFGFIPERVVHARGVGFHGYFESYADWSNLTAAKFLSSRTQTPVFVRFSTVLGSRGSPDTVRDVRGFATRFYTEEGNFDLDGIKFPDVIHATKPEPDREVPQASTAHCTSYDFFSQHTESIHTVMWVLSGRGIARSFRQVEGFGTHTFRFIREDKKAVFVKFIWKPLQGLSNLVWDEAQKIAGKDIDFHRHDMYSAIDRGDFPQYELCVQIVPEEDQFKFPFDLLDATKIIPESIVPVTRLGRMTLSRNVDNFFSETEQVTFHVGHVVRGITLTDDPLLSGRLFSYLDTQLNRMNSKNFMQLPINQPHVPVHNNFRDGFMQQRVFKGKVAYFPNTLQGNTPRVVSEEEGGYLEYPEQVNGTKRRGKFGKFADHFSQAQLFYNSLTVHEQQQIVHAARFELGKCDNATIRHNMVQVFNRVDHNLAVRIASKIGVAIPDQVVENQNQTTVGLSIENYPCPNHIHAKRVAILTAPGIYTAQAQSMYDFLTRQGAYVDMIGMDGMSQTYWTTSAVLYDGVYVPSGTKKAFEVLIESEEPLMFVRDTFYHGKPLAITGRGRSLLQAAVPNIMEHGTAYGVFLDMTQDQFKKGLIRQRYWNRLPLDPNAKPSPTLSKPCNE
ncbi:catalase-like domain-containing protein [Gilbertella persicaria]|uniref:catalase-like domain-containing protein n=1 Tax=Gilbertella persicaria TaxID=101096 RepID=UPI00222064E8|nr:catalase-like domain-containing protein [Gilbertella persicaria]KAI8087589.1 catalase-like domain-containing protein [Gilbertella persicaria]